MKRSNLFVVIGFCLVSKIAFGKVILPECFGDNMVLQQRSTVLLWGWAEPNEKVTIYTSWNHGKTRVRADSRGIWRVRSKTIRAGGPYYIEFTASNHIKLENVLLGEVWLASGQSNMEFTMAPAGAQKGVLDFQKEIANANQDRIRMIDVRNTVADTPVMGISGKWEVCSPGAAGGFSAVAYYFAKKIYEATGTPVGIINSSFGGTPIESWMKRSVLESDADFKPMLDNYEKRLAQYPQLHEEHLIKMDSWHKDTSARKGRAPAAPIGPKSSSSPCKLYNGMIAPLLNYTIAGVIWYQGEANVRDPYLYQKLFPALIRSWRSDLKNDTLPFYFVQIAPNKTQTPLIREAQLRTYRAVANTGIVITTDVGDADDIHPRNKKPVGERLADWALNRHYGYTSIGYGSPLYKSMEIEGNKVIISFDFAEGLHGTEPDLRGFVIAGRDGKFMPAKARIVEDKVEVWSDEIVHPTAVRYGWKNVPGADLFNGAGLPASPFRTEPADGEQTILKVERKNP